VHCIQGEIFDVAVDIRKSSSTFGQWVSFALSGETKQLLFIPPGFAHAYYTVSEEADVIYFMTDLYAPECERGIIWNDPSLQIQWPSQEITLSVRDQHHPAFDKADLFP
jgi:dTDP-4-dehydrorhamnose 3,5-epimerase